MKILTGLYKRRNLIIPTSNNKIRMTTGIVKESIINIFKDFIENSRVVDIFAGSGNVGIEFLSNKAREVIFIEKHPYNINIIKKNLIKLNITENRYRLINRDFKAGIRYLKGDKFDFIYLDPPYKKNLLPEALKLISEIGILHNDSVVIAEHHFTENLADNIESLERFDSRKYGTVIIDMFRLKTKN